jgi:hypothetical protein
MRTQSKKNLLALLCFDEVANECNLLFVVVRDGCSGNLPEFFATREAIFGMTTPSNVSDFRTVIGLSAGGRVSGTRDWSRDFSRGTTTPSNEDDVNFFGGGIMSREIGTSVGFDIGDGGCFKRSEHSCGLEWASLPLSTGWASPLTCILGCNGGGGSGALDSCSLLVTPTMVLDDADDPNLVEDEDDLGRRA